MTSLEFTSSRLFTKNTCDTKHGFRWELGRSLIKSKDQALRVGKLFHKCLEDALVSEQQGADTSLYREPETWQMEASLRDQYERKEVEYDQSDLTEARNLSEWGARFWRMPRPWDELVSVEKVYKAQIGWAWYTESTRTWRVCPIELGFGGEHSQMVPVVFKGILDLVAMQHGMAHHFSWKTTAKFGAVDILQQQLEMSVYEHMYKLLWEANHPDIPYGGVFLGAFSKSSPTKRIAKKDITAEQWDSGDVIERRDKAGRLSYGIPKPDSEGISLTYIQLDPTQTQAVLTDVLRQVEEILNIRQPLREWAGLIRDRDEGIMHPVGLLKRNTSQCFGAHGNSPCAFLDVCRNEINIFNDLVYQDTDPEEHYREVENGGSE